MDTINKTASPNVYRLTGANAWVMANEADIWLIKGERGLTISVWGRGNGDPVESIYLTWDQLKGNDNGL